MTSIEIRRGRLSDVEAIQRCVLEAYAGYIPRLGKRPASMDADFEVLLRDGRAWVIEFHAEVVGLMVLMERADHLEVRSVAVLPAHQKKGLGRALMTHAETVAREQGFSTLRLYTNAHLPELVRYYAALGYVEETRALDQGYDRVFMVKHVSG